MLTTKLDICNAALLKIGLKPITSMFEDTSASLMSRTFFDTVVEMLLTIYPWKFALKEIYLQKDTDGSFLIPEDVLQVIKSEGQIVGNKIFLDENELFITAIVKVPIEDFPLYFKTVLITKLAMEFCIPLIGDQNIFQILVNLYKTELQTAKKMDNKNQEGKDDN